MAMSVSEVFEKAGEHPYITGAVIFGGGLVLLWAFGYLGSSSGSGSTSQTSGAAAYYGAEAIQTQTAGAVQIANLQTTAATAQAGIAAKQAVSIAKTQANAATTINGQNATTAGNIAKLQSTTAMHIADVQGATQVQAAQIAGNTTLGVAATSAGRDVSLAQLAENAAIQVAGIQSAGQVQIANIQGNVASHLADTQYLATVSNNNTALQTVQANINGNLQAQAQAAAAQAAHDAAAVQQAQIGLDQSRVDAQSAADANWINFVLSANTGFRQLLPASGSGGTG